MVRYSLACLVGLAWLGSLAGPAAAQGPVGLQSFSGKYHAPGFGTLTLIQTPSSGLGGYLSSTNGNDRWAAQGGLNVTLTVHLNGNTLQAQGTWVNGRRARGQITLRLSPDGQVLTGEIRSDEVRAVGGVTFGLNETFRATRVAQPPPGPTRLYQVWTLVGSWKRLGANGLWETTQSRTGVRVYYQDALGRVPSHTQGPQNTGLPQLQAQGWTAYNWTWEGPTATGRW